MAIALVWVGIVVLADESDAVPWMRATALADTAW